MPPSLKAIAGLLLTLAAAWVWHGPLGYGERLISGLEAKATEAVARSEVPGIRVSLSRDPLARPATLSGTANDLQREGLGSQKGITDHVRDVEGIGPVRWADEPKPRIVPLLAETVALAALAYLIGLGLGWLLWGRRRRGGFA